MYFLHFGDLFFSPVVLLTFLGAVRNALPLALVCELLASVAEKTFN